MGQGALRAVSWPGMGVNVIFIPIGSLFATKKQAALLECQIVHDFGEYSSVWMLQLPISDFRYSWTRCLGAERRSSNVFQHEHQPQQPTFATWSKTPLQARTSKLPCFSNYYNLYNQLVTPAPSWQKRVAAQRTRQKLLS